MIISPFQSGLMDKAAAMRELKKLSDETGLFESISDEEIEQSRGLTYKDVTSLKDPMAGIEDNLTVDFNPYHGEKGLFTSGPSGGTMKKTKYAPSKRRSKGGITVLPDTYTHLCGSFMTRHPDAIEKGGNWLIEDTDYRYIVSPDGHGGLIIHRKMRRGK